MKKFLSKFLIALSLAAPAALLTSCEEDAPTYINSTADMAGVWTWTTDEGDCNGYFGVTVSQVTDSKISISNFQAMGKTIEMDVDGNSLSFSGKLTDNLEIQDGKGTISNGYQSMNLQYKIYDIEEDETESFSVSLTKGETISKKATTKAE